LLNAIITTNQGNARPYYADAASLACQDIFSGVFGRDVAVFPVTSGTAANALALAHLAQPYEAILCHETAHVNVDEAGAPEFFTHGAKLLPIPGEKGKLGAREVSTLMETFTGSVHQPHPSVISISQPTEWGTCYTLEEIKEITQVARRYGLSVHMDGARLANAICHLGCAPADVTWRAGIDTLSFRWHEERSDVCRGSRHFRYQAVVEDRPAEKTGGPYDGQIAVHFKSALRNVQQQLLADAWLMCQFRRAIARAAIGPNRSVISVHAGRGKSGVCAIPVDAGVNEVSEQGIELKVWLHADQPVVRFACSYCTSESDIQLLLTNIHRVFEGRER
jgi:threonine aldolase